jgi:mono/diheme cytochrome c family protein
MLVFTMLFQLIACGSGDQLAAVEALTGDEANGQVVYDANCAGCHGSSADGGSGPSLLNKSLHDFVEVIPNGEGSMPAFPDITDQEIADMYAFVQTLAN